jgi:lipoprotein-anchoring transpeptidase ErfK/SrfK
MSPILEQFFTLSSMSIQTFSRLLRAVAAAGAVFAVATAAAEAQTTTGATTATATATTVPTTSTATTKAPATATAPKVTKTTTVSKPKIAHKAAAAHNSTTTTTAPVKVKSARVSLTQLFPWKGHEMTIPGRTVHMTTEVAPYVAGQRVWVTVATNGHTVHHYAKMLKPGPGGKYGWIAANVASPRAGHVSVTVSRAGNDKLAGFSTHEYYFALTPSAKYGSRGWLVQMMQARLAKLHIYVHQTGVFDQQTQRALTAYHRLLGLGTATTLDPTVVKDLFDSKGVFHVRFPNQGRHAEGNLSNQTLALIDGKRVLWIYPISSGKESTPTVTGSWRIYERVPGYLPDGMYYSDFFYRGYAIHGYDPSPFYPASHGCMRLWIPDAIQVFDWLQMGDWVDSYGTAPYHLGLGDL